MDKAYAHDDAILQARYALTQRYVVLDTETTGLHSVEVVEVGLIPSDAPGVGIYVKPGRPVEPEAEAVHHITNAFLADKPSIRDEWFRLKPFLTAYRIYGYNVKYDIDAIVQSMHNFGISLSLRRSEVFDVMFCYAAFVGEINPAFGTFKWHKLEDALKATGMKYGGSLHDAVVDAGATLNLLTWIASRPTSWETAIELVRGHINDPEISLAFEDQLQAISYGKWQ